MQANTPRYKFNAVAIYRTGFGDSQIVSASILVDIVHSKAENHSLAQNVRYLLVSESDPAGTSIATFQNRESGGVKFSRISRNPEFELDPTSGVLRTKAKLDRELRDHYVESIQVDDPQGGTQVWSYDVIVTDSNDNPSTNQTRHIVVVALDGKVKGHVAQIRPLDPDLVGPYRCLEQRKKYLHLDTACHLSIPDTNEGLENLEMTIRANDGRHDNVDFTARFSTTPISMESMQNSFELAVRLPLDSMLGAYVTTVQSTLQSAGQAGHVIGHSRRDDVIALVWQLTNGQDPTPTWKLLAQTIRNATTSYIDLVSLQANLCEPNPCQNSGQCTMLIDHDYDYLLIDLRESIRSVPMVTRSIKCRCGDTFAGENEISLLPFYKNPVLESILCITV